MVKFRANKTQRPQTEMKSKATKLRVLTHFAPIGLAVEMYKTKITIQYIDTKSVKLQELGQC